MCGEFTLPAVTPIFELLQPRCLLFYAEFLNDSWWMITQHVVVARAGKAPHRTCLHTSSCMLAVWQYGNTQHSSVNSYDLCIRAVWLLLNPLARYEKCFKWKKMNFIVTVKWTWATCVLVIDNSAVNCLKSDMTVEPKAPRSLFNKTISTILNRRLIHYESYCHRNIQLTHSTLRAGLLLCGPFMTIRMN